MPVSGGIIVMHMEHTQIILTDQTHRVSRLFTENGAMPRVQADLHVRMIQRFDKAERIGRSGHGKRKHRHVFKADRDVVFLRHVAESAHKLVVHLPEAFRLRVLVIAERHDRMDDKVLTSENCRSAD